MLLLRSQCNDPAIHAQTVPMTHNYGIDDAERCHLN